MNIFVAKQIIAESINNNLTEINLSSFSNSEELSDSDLAELISFILELTKIHILGLINLQKLNLSNNQLTTLTEEFGKLSSLQELNLSGNNLYELPHSFVKLKNLRSLSLFGNRLKTLPKEICGLANLQVLNLEYNDIENISPEIYQLSQLHSLDLNANKLKSLPIELGELNNLRSLQFKQNFLSDLPTSFGRLLNLRTLCLDGNQLNHFPLEITKLTNLETLTLDKYEKITVVNFPENRLVIPKKSLNDWQTTIGELTRPGNQITSIPKEIYRLSNLQALSLGGNQINELPIEIAALEKLKSLDLRENPLPFPTEILEDIYNPRKILNFIVDYYEAKKEGKLRPLNEAKLVVIGEANVGKTCVINRLLHNNFIKTNSTHGIEIHRWKNVKLEDSSRVQLNVWDFGGQEIMHSTHQFFFTKRTIYILVINARENQENNKTEEWLQRIKNLSKDSPVFIVGNKIDENNRGTDRTSIGYFDINRKNLTDKFPELIKGFFGISCDVSKTQYNFLFEDFEKALISEVTKLEEIHKEFPANWFGIKDQLENMRAMKIPYITFHDYISRCVKAEIENEESQRTLIDFMHDLGIALSFQDDKELRDLAVLNPEWVTRGVYALIDNAQITLERGILKREDISKYLKEREYPLGETQNFIIKMMRKFKLLVDIEKDKIFLLPDLLPKDEPDTGNWDNALHFQYGYEIYEKSILRSFIVEMYPMRSKETYWRNGIVLVKGTNRALVKADVLKKHITVKIEGNPNTRREFFAVIRREFDKIHNKFESLDVKEKVGHPKYPEILRDYDRLLKMEENGVEMEFIEELEISLPVKDWLDGVESAEERRKSRDKRKFEERKDSKTGLVKIRDENLTLMESRKKEIENLENEIKKINADISNYDELARRMTRFYSIGSFLLLAIIIAAWVYLVLSLDWNFLEPKTYILPIVAMLFSYGVSAWTLKEWNPFKFPEQRFEKEKRKLYEKFGINIEEHKINCNRLTELKIRLKELSKK